jgi:hypothetical protein
MAQFKYLGTTVTNINFIQDKSKRWINSGTIQSRTFCLLICCPNT